MASSTAAFRLESVVGVVGIVGVVDMPAWAD